MQEWDRLKQHRLVSLLALRCGKVFGSRSNTVHKLQSGDLPNKPWAVELHRLRGGPLLDGRWLFFVLVRGVRSWQSLCGREKLYLRGMYCGHVLVAWGTGLLGVCSRDLSRLNQ